MSTAAHDQHRRDGTPPRYSAERLAVCGLVAEISAGTWEAFRHQRMPSIGGEDWFLVEAGGWPVSLFWRDGDRHCAMRLRSPSPGDRQEPAAEREDDNATAA